MAPFLRHVTARMEAAAAEGEKRQERREVEVEVEVFFAHDTTLLPTVALLDLIRVRREAASVRLFVHLGCGNQQHPTP